VSAIVVERLERAFGEVKAVQGIDLEVAEGEIYGFLGPNGAGKSTTMKLLTAQAIADEGSLEVLGHALPGNSKQARAECAVHFDCAANHDFGKFISILDWLRALRDLCG